MPSIPQSVLWIGLVVLWLFVLVPMLINRRDVVRRTSDIALATRVLNGKAAKLLRRSGPAAGHRSDPDFRREDLDEDDEDDRDEYSTRVIASALSDEDKDTAQAAQAMAVFSTRKVSTAKEDDIIDVDVVDEHATALPIGAKAAEVAEVSEDGPRDESHSGTYEYVDDTSGLDVSDEPGPERQAPPVYASSRRRRFDPDMMVRENARKYEFRKRVLMALVAVMIVAGILASTLVSTAWWAFGALAIAAVLYLGYLRRQTRIEEQLRRRRTARYQRSRSVGVENLADRDLDVMPSRLRRPGAVVLEIDDEDPVFEHLDEYDAPRQYRMPHAVGQ